MAGVPLEIRVLNSEPTVVAVSGEIDVSNCGELNDAFDDATRGNGHHLVLDLQDVTFIDSTGLGCLTGLLRRVNRNRGRLALVPGRGGVAAALEATGLIHTFTVASSVDDAVALVA